MSILKEDNVLSELQNTIYRSKNPTRRWLHLTRKDLVMQFLSDIKDGASKSVSEVGPGSGVYLEALCSQFSNVTAVDIERDYLRPLQPLENKLKNLKLIEQDISDINWTQQFDVVLCSEVIEHVGDDVNFIKGLGRMTKSGGVLILSTPQPYSILELTSKIALSAPFIKLVRMIYEEPVLPTGHINLLSGRELTTLLESNGFEIIKSLKFGLYLPLIAEFSGGYGVKFAASIENLLKKLGITWPLWTQLYLAKKVD